jgi:hypothetical protein
VTFSTRRRRSGSVGPLKAHTALAVLATVGLTAGASALAQGGGAAKTPYELPEPSVHSAQVLHMPSASACRRRAFLKVRVTPPPGAVLALLRVRAAGGPTVELTGVPRAASVSVRLTHGAGLVAVTGETLGGQTISMRRTYHACTAQKPSGGTGGSGPPVIGGGES